MIKSIPSLAVPKDIKPRYNEIVALTDGFCQSHLDEEYAGLARRMAAALSRKRPSPLASGQPRTWACGILHALGQINFLSDPATEPCMPMAGICSSFGVGQSTASAKAAAIRKAVKAHRFDPNWSLRRIADQNPFRRLLDIDGFIVVIGDASDEIRPIALGLDKS